jgi:hypothetical protein
MYEQEQLQTVHRSDRRIRDVYPCAKRREGDVKVKCDFVSQRELDLLALIDGHIERIRLENAAAI